MQNEDETEITRVRRPRRAARAWYDTLSSSYGLLADPFEAPYRTAGVEMLDPRPGERIVDIGCGTGRTLVSLGRAVGSSGRAIGFDISDGMCHVARDHAAESSVSGTVDVVCGDALSLPFRNDSLDAAFLSFTLELFDTPEIPAVLGECDRVIRDGGRLCIVSLSRRDAGLATSLYEAVHDALPRYVDCRPIYVRRAVRDAGFDVVDATDETMWGLPVETVLAESKAEKSDIQ